MDYIREMEFIVSFECERCRGPVWIKEEWIKEFGNRVFCSNCGAAYIYYWELGPTGVKTGAPSIGRITYGEMYLPPLEWNEIYRKGVNEGRILDTMRRQRRTFWQRLGDFIRNR